MGPAATSDEVMGHCSEAPCNPQGYCCVIEPGSCLSSNTWSHTPVSYIYNAILIKNPATSRVIDK